MLCIPRYSREKPMAKGMSRQRTVTNTRSAGWGSAGP
jgi:hypothetical protein